MLSAGLGTSASAPSRDELEAVLARAAKYTPSEPYSPQWRDSSGPARWGRKQQARQLLPRTYSGGNCLAAAIGSILGAPIEKVPDPTTVEYHQAGDWLEPYNKRLSEALGYRLEEWPASLCPPRDKSEFWLAGLQDVPDPHVVVCRGHYVIHDSAGELSGPLPTNRLITGFRLIRTRRLVPNVSLGGPAFAVAAA